MVVRKSVRQAAEHCQAHGCQACLQAHNVILDVAAYFVAVNQSSSHACVYTQHHHLPKDQQSEQQLKQLSATATLTSQPTPTH